MANLRMQPVRVDLGDKGVWYRVQAGPLDEKQAHSVCGTLKTPQDRLRRGAAGAIEFSVVRAAQAPPWRSEGPHGISTSTPRAIAMRSFAALRMTRLP